MLNVHKLAVSFGGTTLFDDITFKLTGGDRLGLIGKNGAGKSTLLRILAREQDPTEGDLAQEKGVSIGFLKQDIDFKDGRTVLEEAYSAFAKARKIESRLEEINTQLAERTDYQSETYNDLMVELSELTEKYELIGGYNYKGKTERILKGLAFDPADFNKPTSKLSGGWRMRIELAKLLLADHDILLLDEPTNHLDLDSILWLEGFLNNFSGAVVIVSHDTMFLDQVTNRTIEISLGSMYDYPKPYSKFLELREELREQQEATYKNQQKEIDRMEKLIDRFKAKATKASMAKSLQKKLDKMDVVEVEEKDNAVMNVNFSLSRKPGKIVLKCHDITKSFNDIPVLQGISFTVDRGDRIAFVGQNGQGKSTLAKIIVGELEHAGQVELGHNVDIGYFAQDQAEYLDGGKTVLQTMEDEATDTNHMRIRDMLGAFLFRGDEVFKKVKVLSGGERNRLALCKLMLQPFNLLIMDEPTNHLDIQSKTVLKEALKNFDGTLITVSHDREFLQGLAETVYEFRNHKLKKYLGGIDYYLSERKATDMREIEAKDEPQTPKQPEQKTELNRADKKKKQQLSNKLSKAESKISKLEKEIARIDQQLKENYEETVGQENFFENYEAKKQKLQGHMEEWEQLAQKIDRFN